MDRLPPETQKQLKKMSTARLIAKLGRAGYDLDRLDAVEALAGTMLAEPTAETDTDLACYSRNFAYRMRTVGVNFGVRKNCKNSYVRHGLFTKIGVSYRLRTDCVTKF